MDQVTKAFTRSQFTETQTFALWPNVFEITLTYNKGIAFGQLQGQGVLLAPVALIIAGYATWQVMKTPTENKAINIAWGLLSAGAIGNLIDRVWLGKVTDMFWIRLIDFPVFNVADVCITAAACMLIILWIKEVKETPAEAKESTQPIDS